MRKDKTGKRFAFNGRDGVIFFLSLLLAFSIWLIHSLSQNYTKSVSVPVVALSNIDGHSRGSSNTATVVARCRTRGFDLMRLDRASGRNPIQVYIAPEDFHARGDGLFYITASELNRYVQPIFGVKAGMESFISDTLEFRFPVENSKKVPVYPVSTIACRPQYMIVGGLRMSPDSVTVYGEPHYLDNIDRVYTSSFSLSDLSAPAHGDVRIDRIKGVRLSAEKVEYQVDVRRFVEIRTSLPVKALNVPRNRSLAIFPSTASVTFKCAFPVTVQPDADTWLYVDYADFQNSTGGRCIPELNRIPQGIYGYTVTPEVFECVESVK